MTDHPIAVRLLRRYGRYDITETEVKLLRSVRDGADVSSYATAIALRQLHTAFPSLIEVCEPMGTYGPFNVHPYLGAVATEEGRAHGRRYRSDGRYDPHHRRRLLDRDIEFRRGAARRLGASWMT